MGSTKVFLLALFIYALTCQTAIICQSAQAQPAQEKIEPQGDLKLGEPQTKTLAPGTIHVWSLTLKKGQYAAVEAVENSIRHRKKINFTIA